jgi:glycosyltransferase involved in cell wall biosynthesis
VSDISVIIPVKNRAALLRKTLDNLLSQSKVPNEIIVVDDHSTDEIKLVIFDYITDCIFLNNKGTGPGAARNLGLSVATGKYIQFFDSDDLMTKQKLEKQFLALESTGLDMAYGPYVQAFESENGWEQKDVIMQWSPFETEHNLCEWMLRGWNSITQACLFRKDFIDKCPLWNEQLITHEDYLYLFCLSLLNPGVVHVPDESVMYRQHGKQSTDKTTLSSGRAIDKMEVLTQMRALLPDSNADFLSKGLFKGRLAQNYSFLKSNGIDSRRYSGYVGTSDYLWQFVYRIYNRLKRQQTGSMWEPMHGISDSKTFFLDIVNKL